MKILNYLICLLAIALMPTQSFANDYMVSPFAIAAGVLVSGPLVNQALNTYNARQISKRAQENYDRIVDKIRTLDRKGKLTFCSAINYLEREALHHRSKLEAEQKAKDELHKLAGCAVLAGGALYLAAQI